MEDRYTYYSSFSESGRALGTSEYDKIHFHKRNPQNDQLAFEDICYKCPNLKKRKGLNVLDVGPGCTSLQRLISSLCKEQEHTLYLADCPEMLSHISDDSHIKKYPGFFFFVTFEAIKKDSGGVDVIICNSVFVYDSAAYDICRFADCVMQLLNIGGNAIIGDCTNISKKKRFYASQTGKSLLENLRKIARAIPDPVFNVPEYGELDDTILESVVKRCRSFGFEAYLVPQPEGLAMWWEREDILIRKI